MFINEWKINEGAYDRHESKTDGLSGLTDAIVYIIVVTNELFPSKFHRPPFDAPKWYLRPN